MPPEIQLGLEDLGSAVRRNRIWCILALKHLVATINDFPQNRLTNFVQFTLLR